MEVINSIKQINDLVVIFLSNVIECHRNNRSGYTGITDRVDWNTQLLLKGNLRLQLIQSIQNQYLITY